MSTSLRRLILVATIFIASAPLQALRSTAAAADEPANPGHLKKLLLERAETLRSYVDATRAAYETDTITLEQLLAANQELLEAELEVADSKEKRIAIYKKMVDNARQVEAKVKALHDAGARGGEAEKYYHAKATRLRMEIGLERVRLAPEKDPPKERLLRKPGATDSSQFPIAVR